MRLGEAGISGFLWWHVVSLLKGRGVYPLPAGYAMSEAAAEVLAFLAIWQAIPIPIAVSKISAIHPSASRRKIGQIVRRAEGRDWGWSTQIGTVLKLTEAERLKYRIIGIRPFDVSRELRTKLRREDKAAWEKARRVEMGATPRELSLSQTKPWEVEGISRRTWERERKRKKD